MFLQEIVAALPGLLLLGFTASGGGGTSAFSRRGVSGTERSRRVPSFVSGFLERSLTGQEIPGDLMSSAFGRTRQLLNEPIDRALSFAPMLSWSWAEPHGRNTLQQLANYNPYSDAYAQSTLPLYERVLRETRAVAQTNPQFQRGGVARQGFELADLDMQAALNRFRELHEARQRDVSQVQSAIQLLNTLENMRAQQLLGAEQTRQGMRTDTMRTLMGAMELLNAMRGQGQQSAITAAEILGTELGRAWENMSGTGSQSSSAFSTTCCFIFLEALNGKLPWYVRWGRYCLVTPLRREGYNRMSRWLVPLMRRFRLARRVVNAILVKPFLRWGRAKYVEFRPRRLLGLYCQAWLRLWEVIGYAFRQ